MNKIVLFIFILSIIISSANAAQLESNIYEFNIIENRVLVKNEQIFEKASDINFTIDLLKDSYDIKLEFNGRDIVPIIKGTDNRKKLIIIGENIKTIELSYKTRDLIQDDTFLINIIPKFNTALLRITLRLPPGIGLTKPLEQGDVTSGSIFPKPNIVTTDGQSLIFIWQKNNILKGDELSFFAQYKKPFNLIIIILPLITIIIILLIYQYILKKRKQRTKTIVKKVHDIDKHLKEDEEQIVNILKKREGKCEQGTLRVITGFPKATLSRILKELEERKVIHKEKKGRKNIVFLKEHK